jgi:hypothetical protein
VSIHPDNTAWRAVDACGGTYTREQEASGYAQGHRDALAAALVAVGRADGITTGLLDAIYLALPYVEEAKSDPVNKPGTVAAVERQMRAAIARAEGRQ